MLPELATGLREPLLDCARGALPANVALARAALAAPDAAALDDALARAGEALRMADRPAEADRLRRALALWRGVPGAWATLRAVAGAAGCGPSDKAPDQAVRDWAARFDRAARISPEAGVALYSLGRPELLEEATAEIVAYMEARRLLGRDRIGVEIGCGIGRLLPYLGPRLRAVIAIDVSAGMLAEARRRSRGPDPVLLLRTSGLDLGALRHGIADFVYAVDSFPYLVEAGVAAAHLAEAWRVLRPGGALLVLNYSYRGDLAADRAELAAAKGFRMIEDGSSPFRHWDGRSFLLERLS